MVVLSGQMIRLRLATASDVTERYVAWLNDPSTNLYMGVSRVTSTQETVRDYAASFDGREDRFLFAIEVAGSGEHIGNISLQDIDPIDSRGEIGILVGEPGWRGRGVGTEAIGLVCDFAFDVVGLNKLTAGYVAGNEGSGRAFERNGFQIEGVLREQFRLDDGFADVYRLGLLASERGTMRAREGNTP